MMESAEHPHPAVHRHDHLGHRGHAHDVRADRAQHPVLRARLQVRAGHGDVDAAAQRDAALAARPPARAPAAPGRRRLRHVAGSAGPARRRCGPISGLSPSRLMWSAISTRSPGLQSGFIPPLALETTRTSAPSARMTRTGKVTCAERIALVAVEAALHRHHRLARRAVPSSSRPAVRLHRGAGEVRDLRVGDRRLHLDPLRQRAEPGAQDDPHLAARGSCARGPPPPPPRSRAAARASSFTRRDSLRPAPGSAPAAPSPARGVPVLHAQCRGALLLQLDLRELPLQEGAEAAQEATALAVRRAAPPRAPPSTSRRASASDALRLGARLPQHELRLARRPAPAPPRAAAAPRPAPRSSPAPASR